MWKGSRNLTSVLPPEYKRGLGKPKKIRRREPDKESNPTKLRRKTTKYQCSRCGKSSHNSRRCPLPSTVVEEPPASNDGSPVDASTITGRNQVDWNQDATIANQGPLVQSQMSENESSANFEKPQVNNQRKLGTTSKHDKASKTSNGIKEKTQTSTKTRKTRKQMTPIAPTYRKANSTPSTNLAPSPSISTSTPTPSKLQPPSSTISGEIQLIH
ncbi:hypothetical protein GmHk_12G034995 [Glycine max]|nr:hypothetical protein GmHk_12G034995 [Glycine max]